MAKTWGPQRNRGKAKQTARTSKSSQQEIQYHMDHDHVFGQTRKAYQLSEFKTQECKEAFNMFDTNENETIHTKDLGDLLKYLGYQLTQEELTDIILEVDEDGSGSLGFSEFLSLTAAMKRNREDEELHEAFLVLDTGNSGDIGAAELGQMMTKLGHTLTDDELRGMIREADTTGNGRISYEEFAAMMKQQEHGSGST